MARMPTTDEVTAGLMLAGIGVTAYFLYKFTRPNAGDSAGISARIVDSVASTVDVRSSDTRTLGTAQQGLAREQSLVSDFVLWLDDFRRPSTGITDFTPFPK